MTILSPSKPKCKIISIILAGGAGTRLWPISRLNHPKPFIRLDNDQSLIQKTYLRASSIPNVSDIITVTNKELFFYTKDEYFEVKNDSIPLTFILEPFGRNSAAAIALAAHYVKEQYEDDIVLLVFPADHLVEKQDAFLNAVDKAISFALAGKLTTFGIVPKSPEQGYGYLEMEEDNVRRFIEKPDAKTAESYLTSGNFLWNSGMFCMKVDTILAEMQSHCPDISIQSNKCIKNAEPLHGQGCIRKEICADDFTSIKDISIDHAVFEKSNNIAAVRCEIGWSDIGSWNELGKLYPVDKNANHIFGETVLEDVENSIIYSDNNKVVAGIGVSNLVITSTDDVVLVADRSRVQDVRLIVDSLKNKDKDIVSDFSTIHRPWGTYTILQTGPSFKVKLIKVKPNASLSLQVHKHRSEHWVVVNGQATVTKGDNTFTLDPNQSISIPINCRHRLENLGEQMLSIIEVQCGDHISEDDITQIHDIYGRIR